MVDNKGPTVLGLTWVMRPLAIIIVILRLFTRMKHRKTAGWDDAAIAVCALLTSFGLVWNTLQVTHGFGTHIETMTPQQKSENAKYVLLAELFNFADLFFVRTSVCLFTHRLLPRTQRWSIHLVYVAWVLNPASTLTNMISFSVQCQPTAGLWDYTIDAHCFDLATLDKLFYAGTVLSIIADFIIVIVPMTVIRHVQMTRSIKIGVYIILSFSFITAGLSIGKCIVAKDIRDPYYDSVPVQMFSLFEENLGIIFASVPAMRQLYLSYNRRLLSNGATKPSTDVEDSGDAGRRKPLPSPKSTHSSGIFGHSRHKSIIRLNFEKHRKLHDIAGHHNSIAISTITRGNSGGSHSSATPVIPRTMGCNSTPPLGSKPRQDSLATLITDINMSRTTSITGLRKEGQCATPIISPPADDKMSIQESIKELIIDESPISALSDSLSPLDQTRVSVSPVRPRSRSLSAHGPRRAMAVPIPPPLAVSSSGPTSRPGSRRGSNAESAVVPMASHLRMSSLPSPPAIPAAAGHSRTGSRNKFSLPLQIRTSRSAETLREGKKRTRSLSTNNQGTFYRPDTASNTPQNNSTDGIVSPIDETRTNMIGVTRQAKSMQAPKRPPRSPLWANPMPPMPPRTDKDEKRKTKDTLSPDDASDRVMSRMSTTSSVYAEREGKALPPPPLPPPPKYLTEAREGVRSLYF